MRRDEDLDKWVLVRVCVFVHAFVCEREYVYVE